MFSLVELKTATLDYGITGFSPADVLVVFGMAIAISMIPYLFLYLSLGEKKAAPKPESRLVSWFHAHWHPHLLHHH
jgi:hypothetical protein